MKRILNIVSSKKKTIIAVSITLIVIILGVVIFSNREQILEETENLPFLESINNPQKDTVEAMFSCIKNIEDIKTSKILIQTKHLSKEDDSFRELLNFSLSSNYENKQHKYLKGIFSFEMPMFGVNLDLPIFVNNLTEDSYNIYFDIPIVYKNVFNMSNTQEYIYIDKQNLNYLTNKYKVFRQYLGDDERELTHQEKNIKNIEYIENGESGYFNFNLNTNEILRLFSEISKSEYSNNLVCLFLKTYLRNPSYIDSIVSLSGQIAENNGVLTDIYIEILTEENSLIAIRITFEDINDSGISVSSFSNNKIKDFKDFIDTLSIVKSGDLDQSEHEITINDVFFTGEDESQILSSFSLKDGLSVINVFINFVDCTPQTRLIIRWFYENTEIPIVETKISNGDFLEGVLKSSISFTDSKSIQKGKYVIKIFIEGNDTPVYEESLEITN